MDYQISVRKKAEADILEAFEYYESCRKNLGHDFLLCLEERLNKIRRNPQIYRGSPTNQTPFYPSLSLRGLLCNYSVNTRGNWCYPCPPMPKALENAKVT